MLSLSTKIAGYPTNLTAVDGKPIKFSKIAGDQIFNQSVKDGSFGKLQEKAIENEDDDIKLSVFDFSDGAKDKLHGIIKDIHAAYDIDNNTKCYAVITGADILNQIPPPHSMKLEQNERTMTMDPNKSYKHKLNENGVNFESAIRIFQVANPGQYHENVSESPIFTLSEQNKVKRISIKYEKDDIDEDESEFDDDDDDDDDEEDEIKADEFIKSNNNKNKNKARKRTFTEHENDDQDQYDTLATRMKRNVSKRRKFNYRSRSSSRAPTVSSMAPSREASKGKSISAAFEDYGDEGLAEDAAEYEIYPSVNACPIEHSVGSLIDEESEEIYGVFKCSDGNGNIQKEDFYQRLSSSNYPNPIRESIFEALLTGEGTKLVFE